MTEKLFPILCPTRDFQGPPAWTMIALCNAVRELGKEPVYLQQSSAGYAYIRTLLFHQARQVLKVDSIRGLMIDDDILLTSASAFASPQISAVE